MSQQTRSSLFFNAPSAPLRPRIRWWVRGATLAAATLSLLPIWSDDFSLALVPTLSPFVMVGSILASHAFTILVWLGLTIAVAAIIRRRLFCRWACPVGVCVDGAGWLGRKLGRRMARFPRLGPWIVLLTLGGACLGYPFFLWLDPLARFTGVFELLAQRVNVASVLSVVGFAAILAISFLWPNAWCGRVCPLGAFQDLLSALPLKVKKGSGTLARADAGVPVPRRMLLGAAAGAACAGGARLLGREKEPCLRPPGAVDEPAFSGTCTRCGNCARVCPSGIIERDLGESGWAGLLTPVLSFGKDYCHEDCVRCTEACPSGALRRVSLDKKADIRLGLARVDMSLCLLAEDRECSFCRSRCPYGAIRYVFSETEYALTPQIDPNKCNGCGACEVACPTSPRKAIVVVPT